MALATLQLAAIPLLAGLAAGTGAVATYVTGPDGTTAPAIASVTAAQPDRSCATQAWPYVDRACAAGITEAPREQRAVRVVTAPRPSVAFEKRWTDIAPVLAAATGPAPAAAPPGLTTSDTVLRQPQNLAAIPDAPAAAAPRKKADTRRETQRKRGNERLTAQSYQVPSERGGDMRQPITREVIVVRPRLLDFFR